MGQREDVRASLLASHGVDEVARRKVANDVKLAAINGAGGVADATVKAASLVAKGCTTEARELMHGRLREAGTVWYWHFGPFKARSRPFDPLGGAARGIGRCSCAAGPGTNPGCPVHP